MKYIFVFIALLLSRLTIAQSLQSCRARLSNDTLELENDLIARRFRWKNGQLITLNMTVYLLYNQTLC